MTTTDIVEELDAAQVSFFAEHGYLQLERITDDDELTRLRVIYDEVLDDPGPLHIDHRTKESRRGSLRQIFLPEQRFPEVLDTRFFTSARRMAGQLLGVEPDAVEPRSHMIYKPATYGAATPWHQDAAYRPPDTTERSVNVWMPLDEATVESGCMQFIPGSHVGELLPHEFVVESGSLLTDVKEAQGVDVARAVACPVAPGGATFHTVRTLHHTGPNTTGDDRRAWIIILRAA